MKRIFFLLVIPMMLFGYSFEEEFEHVKIQNVNSLADLKAAWIELDIPTSADTKEAFHDNVAQWFLKKDNQEKLITMIQTKVVAGGVGQSPELDQVVSMLREAFKRCDEIVKKKYEKYEIKSNQSKNQSDKSTKSGKRGNLNSYTYMTCSIAEGDDTLNYVEYLREKERDCKQEATDLFIQFGAEAVGTGAAVVSGAEIVALIEGAQATRHFVQSCGKYCEGVDFQREADTLERQYYGEPEKGWWEFWK